MLLLMSLGLRALAEGVAHVVGDGDG